MKNIVITGRDEELKNALEKNIENVEGLSIAFSMPYGEEMLENLSFAQPDFVICDLLEEQEVRNILEQCLNTTVVFITNDLNRSSSVISIFNKEQQFNFINLDKNKVSPKEVLELLRDYTGDDDGFSFEEISENSVAEKEEIKKDELEVKTLDEVKDAFEDNFIQKNKEIEVVEEKTEVKPIEDFRREINNNSFSIRNASMEQINSISQSQVVAVYSKKGGTGKSTIAKEIANIFSGIRLPKKMSNKETLDVCLVDLDFEQGDLRTMLGITNPSPNLYFLMDAILTKMESNIPLDKIYFSGPEIKTNYCLNVKGTDLKLLCLGQGDIPRKIVERILVFNDDELLGKIIKKIIKILKDTFNIVVIDMSSSLDDIAEVVFKSVSKIVYTLELSLADLDNLKSFLENTKESVYVDNKIIPFLNKNYKTSFADDYLSLYETIREKHNDLLPLEIVAPFDEQVMVTNNNYGFYTNRDNRFKQGIIRVCSKILPIFKIKNISKDMKIVEKKRKLELQKAKAKTIRKDTKALNNESSKTSTNINVDDNNTNIGNINNYLRSDLSRKTVDDFISDLLKCEGVALTKKGFPKVFTKPQALDKKVWKQYQKKLSKSIR